MIHKYLKYYTIVSIVLILTACEQFLSELPTKGTDQPISTLEQLEGLIDGLGGSTTSWRETNTTMAFSTDDNYIPIELYAVYKTGALAVSNLYFYTFNVEDIANQASDALWSNQFALIYRANLILENVDKVSGEPAQKARIRAEAYFLRAYCYWLLANYYCLPYAPGNMQEQGLPKKLTTSPEEDYRHMTLAKTYELIDADLEEALKIDMIEHKYNWRANKASINAFLSRYYMFKGEYDKAIAAADFALVNRGVAKLKDYNLLVAGTPLIYVNPADTIHRCETDLYSTAQMIHWEETFYVRFAYNGTWMMPSPELLALYDQKNDMRYKWFMHPKMYRRFISTTVPVFGYSMFGNGIYAWSGPTIQEVMLNKAESLLRKSTPDIAGALSVVNELRNHRIAPSAPDIHLTASTRDEALIKVLQERRRELPFGHRWWDIRRFSTTETIVDKVTVTHVFYPVNNGVVDMTKTQSYTLPLGSRRYAIPINGIDIDTSQGKIEQNTY